MPRNRKPKPIQNAEPKPATSAEVSKILYSPGFDKLDPELQTAILRKLRNTGNCEDVKLKYFTF
jgi:hypothetical protein